MEPSEEIFKFHTNCLEVILISETYDKVLVLASDLGFKKYIIIVICKAGKFDTACESDMNPTQFCRFGRLSIIMFWSMLTRESI